MAHRAGSTPVAVVTGAMRKNQHLAFTTLEQLEKELSPETFFRVSRKFYIHINHIADIISYTNSRLKIKLNRFREQEIIVSRERVRDFKLWLE